MPYRKLPLIPGQYYHVFNRGINRQPIFLTPSDYSRALLSLRYYHHLSPSPKLSYLLVQSKKIQDEVLASIDHQPKLVTILAFCLMPNHFHLLVRQETTAGISTFMANFQNSYAKYFNAKTQRSGSLLNRQYKSVHIETEEQLLHIVRYIHLNPYSGFVVKYPSQINSYPWSSLREYLENRTTFISPNLIMSHFSTLQLLENFHLDQANYQQTLEKIKHLTFE